jgi:hypothetical protein
MADDRFNLSQVLLCQHPVGRSDGPDAILYFDFRRPDRPDPFFL